MNKFRCPVSNPSDASCLGCELREVCVVDRVFERYYGDVEFVPPSDPVYEVIDGR